VNPAFRSFLAIDVQERVEVFIVTAQRLGVQPFLVEKDFWVCVVLDILFHGRPADHPNLLFKGGTSLSKGFGLIQRFSEDIDIVVYRGDLGFSGERDPLDPALPLGSKERRRLRDQLKESCQRYFAEDLRPILVKALLGLGASAKVLLDPTDPDLQTLLVEYPSLFPDSSTGYVTPRVKIEGGARSALVPATRCRITPYIAEALNATSWQLDVQDVVTIEPARTYLEKVLILHGNYWGVLDGRRQALDPNRISRHYYDVAVISESPVGLAAHKEQTLLKAVREHNLLTFNQPWKRFESAVPGSLHLVPPPSYFDALKNDYLAMQGMLFGVAPPFEWVMDRLKTVEAILNPGGLT
jgi:hypothetical protein